MEFYRIDQLHLAIYISHMHIICNGKKQSLESDCTLKLLLSLHKLEPDTVVAEVNQQIIERDQYSTLKLKDGDTVELIRFVGGG